MDKQEQQSKQPSVDATRRRLTQAGLAAPVVLATLASKNALAAAPYNCTISGMLSGNTSSHGKDQPCAIGRSPGYWKHPGPPVGHAWCCWNPDQVFGGSAYDGATLPDTFYWAPRPGHADQKVWVAPGSFGATQATLVQVLDASFTNGGSGNDGKPYAALARAVIATVQNFCVNGTDYAIRASEAIQMYISVYTSGHYEVKTGVYWSASCCTYYLESLYTLESGENNYGTSSGCVGL
jgi:hypothetical protein